MHPLAVEQNFRARADLRTGWGWALLVAAAALWLCAFWQLLTQQPFNGDELAWVLVPLTLSVPFSAVGAVLLTSGTVASRLRRHEEELRRAEKDEAERRAGR